MAQGNQGEGCGAEVGAMVTATAAAGAALGAGQGLRAGARWIFYEVGLVGAVDREGEDGKSTKTAPE